MATEPRDTNAMTILVVPEDTHSCVCGAARDRKRGALGAWARSFKPNLPDSQSRTGLHASLHLHWKEPELSKVEPKVVWPQKRPVGSVVTWAVSPLSS